MNRKQCPRDTAGPEEPAVVPGVPGYFDLSKLHRGDFPGGAVVKNPPANTGHTGSIPGLGITHMLRSN